MAQVRPDVVYTHSPHEVNRDHLAVYESTLVATCPGSGVSQVYAYETPSSTEWVGGSRDRFSPDRCVDVTGYLDAKIEAFEAYEMEVREFPHLRSARPSFEGRDPRGVEERFEAAEAFSTVIERVSDP